MMTGPLLAPRRPWRLISTSLALFIFALAWMYRQSWSPILLDAGRPVLTWFSSFSFSSAPQTSESGALEARMTQLASENQLLKKKLQALDAIALENQDLRQLLELPMPEAYRKVSAQIILRPPHQWFETLVIDQGFEAGLSVNQVVLNAHGVVGKLIEVSAKTARVQLTSHPESMVSCLIGPERTPGVLTGRYRNQPAHLRYLQNHAEIKRGTEVVTSGLGGVYPPGLSLGRVTHVKRDPALPVPEVEIDLEPLQTQSAFLVVLVPET